MEISERASLIFNNNGSIIVRHAFQTRDGKFHDIVVTDGDRRFKKEEWVDCEKVLINKIWIVYSTCIQAIQKKKDVLGPEVMREIAKEPLRFVYNKNPINSNIEKTKLFINSANGTSPLLPYDIGHWDGINQELDILSTFLLQPHAKVLPLNPKPDVKTTTTKTAKKATADKTVEPESAKSSTKQPDKSEKPAPDKDSDLVKDDPLPPIRPKEASNKHSPVPLPPSPDPDKDLSAKKKHEAGIKNTLYQAMSVLGDAFNPGPLKKELEKK